MQICNGYSPHIKQIPFHNSPAKFRAIITGVSFGKSAAGANELIKVALQYPKSTHLIMAPTSKIMTYATLEQFWKFCPREIVSMHIKSKNLIVLKGGARIIYLSADNERHVDRLRGIEIGSFWADEVRLMPAYVWPVLLTRLREKNGPLRAWVTTTPHGFNWLYYYFVKKKDPRTKEDLIKPEDYEWFGGSTLDNPYTPEEFKETLMNTLSGKMKQQEIYGDFCGFEGMVYSNFHHERHIIKQYDISKFKEFIGGIDWGFSNPMVCLIAGIDGDGRVYIIEEFYRKHQTTQNLATWIKLMKYKYPKLNTFYADPSEPGMINELCNAGISVVRANNDVMPGINFVYDFFELQKDGKPRIYIHESCANLIDEINSYRYAESKESRDAKEEPMKVNDHALDAARYAIYTHLNQGSGFVFLDSSKNKFF